MTALTCPKKKKAQKFPISTIYYSEQRKKKKRERERSKKAKLEPKPRKKNKNRRGKISAVTTVDQTKRARQISIV